MALFDVHIFVQALLYFAALIAGFAISIPIGVNRIHFNGDCILYADTVWNKNNFTMKPSSPSNCDFPIYFSVFGLIFYGLTMGLYNTYAVIRSAKDPEIGSQMWVMPFILINTLMAFTTLIVGCIISVGFLQFCEGITKTGRFKHCADAEGKWYYVKKNKTFDTGSYFELLTVAQTAGWSCLLVWIVQIALSALRFYRNRRLRSEKMMDSAQADQTVSDTANFAENEPTA